MGGVQNPVGCFLYRYVREFGRENGGETFLQYETQVVGEWCLKEESCCVRLRTSLSDPGSLRCALSSSLSPGLPCRCRRSEEAQGSGFAPLCVIQ